MDVFKVDEDREAYLRLLRKSGRRHGLKVWSYCLMTNHIHLVVVPEREDSLGLALHDTHTVYAMRFNEGSRECGHVWQGRFYSCPLDEGHLWSAVRYVERNPVRAAMVSRAEWYPWSSAAPHCGSRLDPLLSEDFPPPGVIQNWPAWLSQEEDEDAMKRLRQQTRTGRPCGSSIFIEQLEDLLNRSLRPQKRGRKKIQENSGTDYELNYTRNSR